MIPSKNVKFTSKRNNCYYDDDKKCVVKKYKSQEDYLNERKMYETLALVDSIHIPKLLNEDLENLILEIEYIDGILFLTSLEELEELNNLRQAVKLMNKLIAWLNNFYKEVNCHEETRQYIYGDVNLRNFIITSIGIIGIDFEQSGLGNIEEELVYLLAMYMMYDPIKSEFKKTLIKKVCRSNQIDLKKVDQTCKNIFIRRANNTK